MFEFLPVCEHVEAATNPIRSCRVFLEYTSAENDTSVNTKVQQASTKRAFSGQRDLTTTSYEKTYRHRCNDDGIVCECSMEVDGGDAVADVLAKGHMTEIVANRSINVCERSVRLQRHKCAIFRSANIISACTEEFRHHHHQQHRRTARICIVLC